MMNLSHNVCIPIQRISQMSSCTGGKVFFILFLSVLLAGCRGYENKEKSAKTIADKETDNLIFSRGKEVESTHYTGRIFITPGIHKAGYDINHLVFEAGSHNDWHIHPDADQLMLVLDGEGYYQEEGKPKQLVKKGDVINTPANVKHWHGATPGSRLVHLSITDRTEKGHIQWFGSVTAEEYRKSINE